MKGKYLDSIEGAVVMTNQNVEEFAIVQNRRFNWVFLPKRKAWIQTLILLPFGLPVGNFLASSWYFSINSIFEGHQYLIGVLSMVVNLLLPSLFFAFLFHWGWFIWHQKSSTWYPKAPALWAGAYATVTIAVSFALVGLFTHSLGICGNPAWGEVGKALLCNLDGYAFESKSWFGAWFIIAAYSYQVQNSILQSGSVNKTRSQLFIDSLNRKSRTDLSDFRAVATNGDGSTHDDLRSIEIDPIIKMRED